MLIQNFFAEFYALKRMFKTLDIVTPIRVNRRFAWREMCLNYKVRKAHPVRIISLGFDCMVRTVLTEWLLMPDRRAGQKSMVFDRAGHAVRMVADSLEKDFADYFDNWKFNPAPELRCWFNMSQNTPSDELPLDMWGSRKGSFILYMHDRDCGPLDEGKLKAKTRVRLDRFLDTLAHPHENDLYVLHKRLEDKPEDVERLCARIRAKRGTTPTRILVVVTDFDDSTEAIAGGTVRRCIFPFANTVWGQPDARKTRRASYFGVKLARACRRYIAENF